jgi:hypothetical protein
MLYSPTVNVYVSIRALFVVSYSLKVCAVDPPLLTIAAFIRASIVSSISYLCQSTLSTTAW